jgi:hypothetical protein
MHLHLRSLVVIAALASSVSSTASYGGTLVAPAIGTGAWTSKNVSWARGCSGVRTGSDNCEITADSEEVGGTPGCKAATLAVLSDTHCSAVFTADLALTGSGADQSGDNGDADYDIEVGACAGLTLSEAQVQIHDPYAGDFVVYPRVLVTNAGWTIQGNLVGVNVATQSVVVLHVAATIKPACTRVRVRRGETTLKFNGVFSGSYSLL